MINNIIKMEKGNNVLCFMQQELNNVVALKKGDSNFRRLLTNGNLNTLWENDIWEIVHITEGTFLRCVEQDKVGQNKNVSVIVTPQADLDMYKAYIQIVG